MTPFEALRGIKVLLAALDNPELHKSERLQRLLLTSIEAMARKGLTYSQSASDLTNEELMNVLRNAGVKNPEELTSEQLKAIAEGGANSHR